MANDNADYCDIGICKAYIRKVFFIVQPRTTVGYIWHTRPLINENYLPRYIAVRVHITVPVVAFHAMSSWYLRQIQYGRGMGGAGGSVQRTTVVYLIFVHFLFIPIRCFRSCLTLVDLRYTEMLITSLAYIAENYAYGPFRQSYVVLPLRNKLLWGTNSASFFLLLSPPIIPPAFYSSLKVKSLHDYQIGRLRTS